MNIFYIIHSVVCNELLQILNMLKSEIQIFQGARKWIIKGRYETRISCRVNFYKPLIFRLDEVSIRLWKFRVIIISCIMKIFATPNFSIFHDYMLSL